MSEANPILQPPKGERAWVSYHKEGALAFMLTSKENSRDFYFLYEIVDGSIKKLGRSRSPLDLESRFEIYKRLGITR